MFSTPERRVSPAPWFALQIWCSSFYRGRWSSMCRIRPEKSFLFSAGSSENMPLRGCWGNVHPGKSICKAPPLADTWECFLQEIGRISWWFPCTTHHFLKGGFLYEERDLIFGAFNRFYALCSSLPGTGQNVPDRGPAGHWYRAV